MNSCKQKAYHDRMKEKGFLRKTYFVHDDDLEAVKSYALKKFEKRKKLLGI